LVDPAEAAKEEMMGNLVSIDRGRFLGDYISRQKAPKIVGDGLFLLGVVVTIVVPQVVYCAIGDPVTPWVFVVTAQAGVIAGLVKFIRPPAAPPSVLGTQTEPTSRGDRARRRKLS
jgi:hypothetical protein